MVETKQTTRNYKICYTWPPLLLSRSCNLSRKPAIALDTSSCVICSAPFDTNCCNSSNDASYPSTRSEVVLYQKNVTTNYSIFGKHFVHKFFHIIFDMRQRARLLEN